MHSVLMGMKTFFLSVLLGYCGVNSNDLAEQTSLTHAIEKESLHIRHVFRESIPRLSTRQDLSRLDRLHHEYIHKVIFVIQQKNMDKLTDILHDISDPLSENYGMHMTKEEISIMTSNPVGHDAIMTYLHAKGVTTFHETLNGEFITASAPISVWEQTFDTQFFSYHQKQRNGETEMFVRAEKYSVPIELDDHVATVFNTIQLPYQLSGNLKNKIIETETEAAMGLGMGQAAGGGGQSHNIRAQVINAYAAYTTPQKLRAAYNMGDSMGSNKSTQAVYATIGQYFSPADLAAFQIAAKLPNRTVSSVPYGFSSDKACKDDPSDCVEGNLDIQYIMAMSPVSPTTYWYSTQGFASWLFNVALAKVAPLVISLSYGADEALMTVGEMENFNVYAIKLSTAGSTIFVAAGDDGAIVHDSKAGGQAKCGYSPSFPSTCPYITSVGATQGIDRGTPEIVCQYGKNCTFTSGGGFSNFYTEPIFQSAAVADYIDTAKQYEHSPYPGYGIRGRGYPDIAFAGAKFLVRIGGKFFGISGTSASAPAVAGMFSNINAERMALGKGPVGWINPALYSNADSFVNDITSGDNHCASDGLCCPQGYWAGPGWDPVTGLGTLNYGLLSKLFVELGQINGAKYFPSYRPIFTPRPSTGTPSYKPSTATPSSGRPSRTPTGVPSASPTPSTYTYMEATQVISGITLDHAIKPVFLTALRKTLLTSMGAPLSAVVEISVNPSGRRMLTNVQAKYDISIDSGLSEATLQANLRQSLDSGAFLYVLKLNTGISTLKISNFVILKISPTHLPTAAPVESSGGGGNSGGNSVIYAVVGAGVAVLVIIGAVTFYCKCRRKKHTDHTGPNGAISRFDAHNGRQVGSLSGREVPRRGLTRQPTLDEYGLPGPSEPVYDFDTTPDKTEN